MWRLSDRAFDISKLLLDKTLLVFVGGLIAYWFSRASDRKRDRGAWARARADQRIATYREISTILAAQFVDMHRFARIVAAAHSTPNKIDFVKAEQFATQLFHTIAARHYEKIPALLVASPFVGDALAKPLNTYQKISGRFSDLVEPSFGVDAKPVSFEEMNSLILKLSAAWNEVQLAIRDEFNTPPE